MFDLATPWYSAYNDLHPDNPLTEKNVTSWDMPNAKYQKDLFGILHTDIYRHLQPLPGSIETLKEISQLRCTNGDPFYKIIVVTAGTIAPHTFTDKLLSLQEHFPFIPIKDTICAYHKGMIKADYWIDDGPHNLESLKLTNPLGVGIALEYPYNSGRLDFADHVCDNWDTIRKVLKHYFYRDAR
jgi:5'(3')-deoxyribonucleotidase